MTRNFCSSMNSSQIRHENSQEKTQKTLLPVDSTPSGLSFLVTMTTWVGRSMKMCQESLVRSVITRQKLLLGSMNRKLSHLIDTPRSNEPLVIILAKSTLQPSKLPLPLQLFSSYLWNDLQHSLPHPLCDRPRPLLPSHAWRRCQAEIP